MRTAEILKAKRVAHSILMLSDSDTCSHDVLDVEMREGDGRDASRCRDSQEYQSCSKKVTKVAQSVDLFARPQRL